MAILIKSPQHQYMFDKRFEMTEDSASIHSNHEQKDTFKDINDLQDSLRLGLDSLDGHNNSKSLKQSPNNR